MYEKAVVAYVDILGFKNLVSKSTNDEKVYKDVEELFREVEEQFKNQDHVTEKITIFASDSIFLIFPIQKNDLISIFWAIAYFQNEILNMGFLLRGGISFGDVKIVGNNAFGPAICEAVSIEANIERGLPMIKISNQFFFNFLIYEEEFDNEVYKELRDYLKIEAESAWISHLISEDYFEYTHEQTKENLQNMITKFINNDDDRIVEKYKWLNKTYF